MTQAQRHGQGAGRLVRLSELERPHVGFCLDGTDREALAGDTVLTAVLSVRTGVRRSEFGPENRAGFCLMGACQDCWIWQEDGTRLRACSTYLVEGMRLTTTEPEGWLR
ncbi:(2Fe-2S)-binding protein [Shinella sp. PSBB067]|uniref:(2Fe-2S)-binding protein n=1 Tax=Shinella sp. PSBB067 TaxID=2715959 RepID=UPI00193B8976|nr:(2Fe-2S)-binding protein [Shinella sp. PSBB067]QRI62332.1 (2Fe-2S)-binding protein [Shinella sp. PSBB067]